MWRKVATDYKDTKKKTELWTRKARELNIEEGAEVLRTWWKSVRDLYALQEVWPGCSELDGQRTVHPEELRLPAQGGQAQERPAT